MQDVIEFDMEEEVSAEAQAYARSLFNRLARGVSNPKRVFTALEKSVAAIVIAMQDGVEIAAGAAACMLKASSNESALDEVFLPEGVLARLCREFSAEDDNVDTFDIDALRLFVHANLPHGRNLGASEAPSSLLRTARGISLAACEIVEAVWQRPAMHWQEYILELANDETQHDMYIDAFIALGKAELIDTRWNRVSVGSSLIGMGFLSKEENSRTLFKALTDAVKAYANGEKTTPVMNKEMEDESAEEDVDTLKIVTDHLPQAISPQRLKLLDFLSCSRGKRIIQFVAMENKLFSDEIKDLQAAIGDAILTATTIPNEDETENGIAAWIVTVASNCALKYIRKRSGSGHLVFDDAFNTNDKQFDYSESLIVSGKSYESSSANNPHVQDLVMEVATAKRTQYKRNCGARIDELPAEDREYLLAAYEQTEIAQILGETVVFVKNLTRGASSLSAEQFKVLSHTAASRARTLVTKEQWQKQVENWIQQMGESTFAAVAKISTKTAKRWAKGERFPLYSEQQRVRVAVRCAMF